MATGGSREIPASKIRSKAGPAGCAAAKRCRLTYLIYILSNARNRAVQLPTPDEFATLDTAPAGRCAL